MIVQPCDAAIVFQEDFDSDHTADWVTNASAGDHRADFFFNYGSVGIPPAPNSAGTTFGVKLQANVTGSTFGGISVSPKNQQFTGDYRLRFDMWLNFNGPLDSGFIGSTQLTGAGIGTDGTEAEWGGGTQNSVHFGVTGDGDVVSDYRAYSSLAPGSYQAGDPVYFAPSRDNFDPYYAQFGNQMAPPAQLALYPQQTGSTRVGTQAFAWRDVVIDKEGDFATFSIDGLPIAKVDLTTVTLSGGNILFNQYDINTGSSSDPNASLLLFGLIDNVRVEAVPEPSAVALCWFLLGSLGLRRQQRKNLRRNVY
jgi:hypothetical protein